MKIKEFIDYALLDLGLPGKLAGSSEPGYSLSSKDRRLIFRKLQNGVSVEESGASGLMLTLNALAEENIQVIYNLIPSPSPLVKFLWESQFEGKTYITNINEVIIAIDDFDAPNQKQLKSITDDVIRRMQNGENILVHCEGGRGRTGTILSAIYMKINSEYNAIAAINYIREHYSNEAVESEIQQESLGIFGENLRTSSISESFITRLEEERKTATTPTIGF